MKAVLHLSLMLVIGQALIASSAPVEDTTEVVEDATEVVDEIKIEGDQGEGRTIKHAVALATVPFKLASKLAHGIGYLLDPGYPYHHLSTYPIGYPAFPVYPGFPIKKVEKEYHEDDLLGKELHENADFDIRNDFGN